MEKRAKRGTKKKMSLAYKILHTSPHQLQNKKRLLLLQFFVLSRKRCIHPKFVTGKAVDLLPVMRVMPFHACAISPNGKDKCFEVK